jgi:hypothetical protein
MEKFTYDFSKDFKRVFENLTSGRRDEGVQFLKVPVRTGKTYSCEQYMIKFLERVKNDEDLLRKIVIFTTEKNILADSTYMNVLEGVEKDSNLILFKQELYEESNRKFERALNTSNKDIVIICSFSYIFSEKISALFYKARSNSDELVLLVDEGEALLNSLHSSVSICACKNRSFGTGINGNVINALNKPTAILKFNGDVTRTSNLKIEGYILANPTSTNTYEFSQFLEESKSRVEAEKKLALIIQPSGGNYDDFTVYKQISSIKFKLGVRVYDLCTITENNEIRFDRNIFETIQTAFEKDYCLFYTLLALITKILNSNMIYLKYNCVTSPSSMKDLSYNEATEKYSAYKAAKASNNKTSTSDFFLYKKVGRLYETQLCFNENSSLFRTENIADSIILLSGTWNEWLLNLMYSNKPFIFQETLTHYVLDENDRIDRMENLKFKSDLFLLRFLLSKYRSKIPSSFLSHVHSITIETNLENRFTNEELNLQVQKTLSEIED